MLLTVSLGCGAQLEAVSAEVRRGSVLAPLGAMPCRAPSVSVAALCHHIRLLRVQVGSVCFGLNCMVVWKRMVGGGWMRGQKAYG